MDPSIIVGVLIAALAIISVALRFWSRRYTKTGLGWDDGLILLALLATLLTDALIIWATSSAPGADDTQDDPAADENYTPSDVLYNKAIYAATVLYFTITSSTKLSIVLMYHRLFSVDPSFRSQIIAAGVLVSVYWLGLTLAAILQCVPVEYNWIPYWHPEYCFNFNVFWFVTGILEAAIDIYIIAMPIRMVLRLQLSTSRKIATTAVFLLGVFVIASGLVKAIVGYSPGSHAVAFDKAEIWTEVHCCTGIVCACLPVCWQLFIRLKHITPSWASIPSIWSQLTSVHKSGSSRVTHSSSERQLARVSDEDVLPMYNITATKPA
ncbi:hypothetical protein JX266_009383 [Neoarthrinium moseri]|nr:hypothetical protein JX266_009383 [Neoarthrinium moseri]